jgi:hypothetical protein
MTARRNAADQAAGMDIDEFPTLHRRKPWRRSHLTEERLPARMALGMVEHSGP